MLWACGIVLPFMYQHALAQRAAALVTGLDNSRMCSDTLVVKLQGNGQLWIVGKQFEDVRVYAEKVDEVKTTFLADLTKAYQGGLIRNTSTEVYYFYNGQTSRRVKAEAPDYVDARINVTYEQLRITQSLPKFHYTIFDLANGQEWHLFINNSDSVMPLLSDISLKMAIQKIADDKKLVKKYTRFDVSTNVMPYTIEGKTKFHADFLEITPFFGVTLLGNQVSPVLGGTFSLRHNNKYDNPTYKTGLSLTGATLMSMNGTDISMVSVVNFYDAFFALNLNSRSKGKTQWIGLQGGLVKATDSPALKGAYKVGLTVDGLGGLGWSIDVIKTKHTGSIYGLTVKMPF